MSDEAKRISILYHGIFTGNALVDRDQQLSNTFRRNSSETFRVLRPDVHSAETNKTNWRSGIPGRWIFRVCMVIILIAATKGVNFSGLPTDASANQHS